MVIRVEYDRLIHEARSTLATAEAAGATTPEELQALRDLEDRWQTALDGLVGVARDLNSLDGLTRIGLRNRLGHLSNGAGFGGVF